MYVKWGPIDSGLNLFLWALTVSGNNPGIGLTPAQGGLSNPQELQRETTQLEELSLLSWDMVKHQGGK